jgi:hypothetical protein
MSIRLRRRRIPLALIKQKIDLLADDGNGAPKDFGARLENFLCASRKNDRREAGGRLQNMSKASGVCDGLIDECYDRINEVRNFN